jgi:DNA segregation ATPase FtsK/SpoIIIE-like protein
MNDAPVNHGRPGGGPAGSGTVCRDEFHEEARRLVRSTTLPSVSFLQRKLHVDFDRAARILRELEVEGVFGVPGPDGRQD